MSSCLTKSPYDNILVKNQDGLEIFTCDFKRANWYLTRNLAKVESEVPMIITLKFKTNGLGHYGDPYFLQDFKNVCVVCGTTKNLTRHHVFPQQFNKFVPRQFKNFMRSNSYNVKLLCVKCHVDYEKVATEFKIEILEKAGYNFKRHTPEHFDKAKRAAWALFNYSNAIQKKDYPKLFGRLEKFFNKKYSEYDFTVEVIEDIVYLNSLMNHLESMNKGYESFFKEKIVTLDDLNDFVIMWRKHFVDTMWPRYLPKYWDIERRFNMEGK